MRINSTDSLAPLKNRYLETQFKNKSYKERFFPIQQSCEHGLRTLEYYWDNVYKNQYPKSLHQIQFEKEEYIEKENLRKLAAAKKKRKPRRTKEEMEYVRNKKFDTDAARKKADDEKKLEA